MIETQTLIWRIVVGVFAGYGFGCAMSLFIGLWIKRREHTEGRRIFRKFHGEFKRIEKDMLDRGYKWDIETVEPPKQTHMKLRLIDQDGEEVAPPYIAKAAVLGAFGNRGIIIP